MLLLPLLDGRGMAGFAKVLASRFGQPCWLPSGLHLVTQLPGFAPSRRLAALSLEAASYSELRSSLQAAHNRSNELSEARRAGAQELGCSVV